MTGKDDARADLARAQAAGCGARCPAGAEHYPPHDETAEALDALSWPSDNGPYPDLEVLPEYAEDQQQRQARQIHGIEGRTLEDPGEPGSGPPP